MPHPLRVTFVITDLHVGGSPRVVRDLAIGLARSFSFEVSVVSLKPLPKGRQDASIPRQLAAAGVAVHSLELERLGQLPRAVPRLVHLLQELQPDVVYAVLIHANMLSTLAMPFVRNGGGGGGKAIKFIQSIHTLQPEPAWHWYLQGMLSPFADAVVVPAKPILERISRFGDFQWGEVIPNGIDIERFANATPMPAAECPWPAGAPVVGYIGRFDPVKNLPLLLRSFARLLQNWKLPAPPHLALIGYGPQEEVLRSLSTSLHLGPFAHFLPPTSTPERWYKSFTVHCLPSTVEGFGLTLVESVAAGTPVLALETPVTRALVRVPNDGLLAPETADERTLVVFLKELINRSWPSPLSPTGPSEEALSYLRSSFSISHMVELHANFLQKLVRTSN